MGNLHAAAPLSVEPAGFERSRRIVRIDEFSSVFRMRAACKSPHFALHAVPGQHSAARLGLVVGKRFAPRAVTRNAIKRLVRETFRTSTLPVLDIVVRLNASVARRPALACDASLKRLLRAELDTLFARLWEMCS